MAEARITQDDPKNPIITGDQVYSQVWHRGKKLRFALTGIIDFDNDGVSDMQLARELIELNGGIVDAYVRARRQYARCYDSQHPLPDLGRFSRGSHPGDVGKVLGRHE